MITFRRILISLICFCGIIQFSCDNDLVSPNRGLRLYRSVKLPSIQNFVSVEFVDDRTGWGIGKKGTIYYTNDGGINWEAQRSGIEDDLAAAQFLDYQNGWIVGENNLIGTNDGGKTWHVKISNVPFSRFAAIYFCNKNIGWVSGSADGKIYHTTDSGKNWTIQQTDTMGRVVSLFFDNSTNGFSLSNIKGLYRTTNGGKRWSKIEQPRFCSTVNFISNLIGYAGNNVMPSSLMKDEAQIFKSNDGGNTWEEQNFSPQAKAVWEISFLNASVGFAIAGGLGSFSESPEDWLECGNLFFTMNGGNNWNRVERFTLDVIDVNKCGRNKVCVLTKKGEIQFFEMEII